MSGAINGGSAPPLTLSSRAKHRHYIVRPHRPCTIPRRQSDLIITDTRSHVSDAGTPGHPSSVMDYRYHSSDVDDQPPTIEVIFNQRSFSILIRGCLAIRLVVGSPGTFPYWLVHSRTASGAGLEPRVLRYNFLACGSFFFGMYYRILILDSSIGEILFLLPVPLINCLLLRPAPSKCTVCSSSGNS